MATHVPCKKNDANGYIFYISLVSRADTRIFQANPTLAAGDFKIAVNDGAPNNLGTLPVVDADFTKRVKVVLSQAETNGDNVTIICSDADGAQWCDLTINIQTSAQTIDEMDVNIDDIETDTAVIGALGAGLTNIPWNAAWDAEVQSECADALNAYDPPTKGEMDAAHALLATPAQVNAEVVDALTVDTIAELLQAVPAATPTIATALMLLYMIVRNKLTATNNLLGIYNDAGTRVVKKALDDDGVTYTETKAESGA